MDPPDRRMKTIRVPVKESNPGQLDLSTIAPPPPPPALTPAEQEATLQEKFLDFHRANPHVYAEIVKLARRAKGAGATRVGIGMIFEVLRWRHTLRTGGDPYKLNNNYRSRYVRMIIRDEPDLAEVFEIRELQTP